MVVVVLKRKTVEINLENLGQVTISIPTSQKEKGNIIRKKIQVQEVSVFDKNESHKKLKRKQVNGNPNASDFDIRDNNGDEIKYATVDKEKDILQKEEKVKIVHEQITIEATTNRK